MKASEIKRGNVVEHNGKVWQIRDIERSSPTARGGNVTFRFTMYSVPGAQKLDLSLRADDELKETEVTRRAVTYSYMDGEVVRVHGHRGLHAVPARPRQRSAMPPATSPTDSKAATCS